MFSYSYQQVSSLRDFGWYSCDGKSIAEDIGCVSEFVDSMETWKDFWW